MSDSLTVTPPPVSPVSSIVEIENEDENENEYVNENRNENKEEKNTKESVFKISNQTITRRFTLPTEKPTWSEIELKVRETFSIPSSVSPGLTYVDEENDNITISSQIELEDFYKQVKFHDLSDINHVTYRFNLVIFTPIKDFADNENNDGNISPGIEEQDVPRCPTQ